MPKHSESHNDGNTPRNPWLFHPVNASLVLSFLSAPCLALLSDHQKIASWTLVLTWVFILCIWTTVVLVSMTSNRIPVDNQITHIEPSNIRLGTVGVNQNLRFGTDLSGESILSYAWVISGVWVLVTIIVFTFVPPMYGIQPSYSQAMAIYLGASVLSFLSIVGAFSAIWRKRNVTSAGAVDGHALEKHPVLL